MAIVVHHNPACGTSRKVLEIVAAAGHQPVVIEYLKEGWTRPQLLALFAAAGLTAREALRAKTALGVEPGLLGEDVPAERLIEAMIRHPELVERPIVCTPRGVRLCRPAETVLDLLDPPARDGDGQAETTAPRTQP